MLLSKHVPDCNWLGSAFGFLGMAMMQIRQIKIIQIKLIQIIKKIFLFMEEGPLIVSDRGVAPYLLYHLCPTMSRKFQIPSPDLSMIFRISVSHHLQIYNRPKEKNKGKSREDALCPPGSLTVFYSKFSLLICDSCPLSIMYQIFILRFNDCQKSSGKYEESGKEGDIGGVPCFWRNCCLWR